MVSNIVFLLCKDFWKLVCIALLIAFPLSWWALNGWLQRFAYHINMGTVVIVVSGFAILLIALTTISFQAIKAAIAKPSKKSSHGIIWASAFIPEVVQETLHHTKALAQKLKGKTSYETCSKIWHFVYQHIAYKKNLEG